MISNGTDDLSCVQRNRARTLALIAHPSRQAVERARRRRPARLERDEVQVFQRDVRREMGEMIAHARSGIDARVVDICCAAAEMRAELIRPTT